MTKVHMDSSWKGWLKENIKRKCGAEQLLAMLIKNNFTIASIKKEMGEYYPAHSPLLVALGEEKPSNIDHKKISQTRITRLHSGAKRFPSDKLQLYTLENFMSEKECDTLIEIINPTLRPSTVTLKPKKDNYYRTSSTSDLSLLNHKTVKALDEKIARALGIQLPYSESIQGQYYAVGQEFKQHTDYFEPKTKEFAQFGGAMGNRTWTFMVYLNNVPKGGGTRFFEIDQTFPPKKGMAVIWNNLHSDGIPNCDTMHAGLPVEEGHKVIITKWFRERGKRSMFY